MPFEDHAKLLKQFTWQRGRWQLALPSTFGTFFSREIRLEFDPKSRSNIQGIATSKSLMDEELAFIHSLLASLPTVIATCETQFTQFCDSLGDVVTQIDDPYIWIWRESFDQSENGHWTFVVQFRDSDSGVHIEFDGLTFSTIWSGG
ncbi:MAG: hypothetical protein QM754_06935 [Tepidisphaeraceae bacterium]